MIAFGSVFLELVFGHVRELPLPGEEVFTDEFAISCGGAVTSATAAARAGARAGVCTLLGDDFGSRVVAGHCARNGVDVSSSKRVRGRCAGVSVVLNFDGDRAFVTHVPPRSQGEGAELDRWRGVLHRERPRWCYIHAGEGVADFVRDAHAVSAQVVLDMTLGDERQRETVIECVRLADVFVPNEAELLRLTGTDSIGAALSAARAWETPLVVKRGAAGALIAGREQVTEVAEGVRDVPVRDLTGAGDAFAGAMIAALLDGASLTAAVAAANAAGSEAVARLGAVGEVDIAEIGAEIAARGPFTGDAATAGGGLAPVAGPGLGGSHPGSRPWDRRPGGSHDDSGDGACE